MLLSFLIFHFFLFFHSHFSTLFLSLSLSITIPSFFSFITLFTLFLFLFLFLFYKSFFSFSFILFSFLVIHSLTLSFYSPIALSDSRTAKISRTLFIPLYAVFFQGFGVHGTPLHSETCWFKHCFTLYINLLNRITRLSTDTTSQTLSLHYRYFHGKCSEEYNFLVLPIQAFIDRTRRATSTETNHPSFHRRNDAILIATPSLISTVNLLKNSTF